ncbi:MAG: flagellar basal body rod protein FlgC [Deltaproteobacteria bacterium]|nr:flagellar basal body rod protein FlgC [Deltaproteobacteria bacterium]
MNIFTTMEISASGMTAQRQRLNVIAENLANAHTTRTPQGGPYLRKNVILESRPVEDFASFLEVWPNVNPVAELVSLTLASRAFEANVAVFRAARTMALKALEIGR